VDTEKSQELVRNHLGLVSRSVDYAIWRHHLPSNLREDFMAAGKLGLVEAASRFEPDRGVPFLTYAFARIRGAIFDEVKRGAQALKDKEALELPLKEAAPEPPHPEKLFLARERAQRLHADIERLPLAERKLVQACYGEGLSFTEYAKRAGISKGWVSRLHERALNLLRDPEQSDPELER
jgi:RNA polymerase sigma factor for flagellar operon FliA